MQAVMLAGGLGTRLRPFTEQVPKPLVVVRGKPFLCYLLDLLKENGVEEAVLCLGYLAERVVSYFGDGRGVGLRLRYSVEKELLGTAGALKLAQPLLKEWFFLINGDTYLPISYRTVARIFLACAKMGLMVIYDNPESTGVRANVALDNSTVAHYDKSGLTPGLKYVEAGVLLLRREALELVAPGKPCSLEEALYPLLISQREMRAYISPQRFYDIGTPQRLAGFEEFLSGRGR